MVLMCFGVIVLFDIALYHLMCDISDVPTTRT